MIDPDGQHGAKDRKQGIHSPRTLQACVIHLLRSLVHTRSQHRASLLVLVEAVGVVAQKTFAQRHSDIPLTFNPQQQSSLELVNLPELRVYIWQTRIPRSGD